MHDALVAEDVIIEPLEMADPVWHAREIGMDRDRHYARNRRALLVKAIEMVDAAPIDLIRGLRLHRADHDIVDFDAIGHGYERPLFHRQAYRLIVQAPVADIFDPGLASHSSVSAVSVRPGLSHPRGGRPVNSAIASIVRRIASR